MTTESATQQGVQQQSTPPQKPTRTDRMADMERLAEARREVLAKEIGMAVEDFNPVAPSNPDEDEDEAAAAAERERLQAIADGAVDDTQRELQDQSAVVTPQEPAFDLKTKRKLKIDGVEREMTIEEMEREVQKGLTADRRLEQAARERQEIADARRQLEAAQATIQQASQQQAAVQVDPALAIKFTTALQTGDVEQATQAFNEAVSGAVKTAVESTKGRDTATPPVDPQAIAAQVRQQIAIESVLDKSRADYPQLYADPDIEAVAASKISRLQGEGKPFAEALENVQTELATKFGWKKAAQQGRQTPAPDTNRREERRLRKDAMDTPPSGLSVKSGTTEEPTPSVHDVIRDMAKARGQTV